MLAKTVGSCSMSIRHYVVSRVYASKWLWLRCAVWLLVDQIDVSSVFFFFFFAQQGVISRALNWDMLEEQFHSDLSYKEEIAEMIKINDKVSVSLFRVSARYELFFTPIRARVNETRGETG